MKSAGRRGIALVVRPDRVEASLWRSLKTSGDEEARKKLFDFYQPFARKLAGAQFAKRRTTGVERGDIEQLAYEALLQAISRFEPTRSIPFESYAQIRISGHISNGLASMSEAAAQYRYRQRAERDRLRSMREASPDTPEDSLAALARLAATLALGLMAEDALSTDPDSLPDEKPTAYESLVWRQMAQKLREAIDELPERESYIVRQHYRNDVSFQQIAALLGVSKGRVSQIHRSALLRLRERLAKFR